jgi:hypothetical protein
MNLIYNYKLYSWMFTIRISIVFVLNLNNVNQLIFVTVKCGVLFEVRTNCLNNI